ncbi:MAG: nitroreductase family protein [Methanobacteriota archaeon]
MEFRDVVKERTSIRSFSDQKVEPEKFEYVLECARLAPSWANKQCWRFLVVTETETIQELAKTSIINRWLKNAPILIVACGDPSESGDQNDIDYYLVDVAIAMEHLVLAATDAGLGTCWIGGFDEQKVKEILGLPKRMRVVALSPLGYPLEKKGTTNKIIKAVTRGTKRKSLVEIVRYEKW